MLALAVGDVPLVQTVEPNAPEHLRPVLRLEFGKIGKRREPALGQVLVRLQMYVHF